MIGLVELHRELITVGENNFVGKRGVNFEGYSKSVYTMFKGTS